MSKGSFVRGSVLKSWNEIEAFAPYPIRTDTQPGVNDSFEATNPGGLQT